MVVDKHKSIACCGRRRDGWLSREEVDVVVFLMLEHVGWRSRIQLK